MHHSLDILKLVGPIIQQEKGLKKHLGRSLGQARNQIYKTTTIDMDNNQPNFRSIEQAGGRLRRNSKSLLIFEGRADDVQKNYECSTINPTSKDHSNNKFHPQSMCFNVYY